LTPLRIILLPARLALGLALAALAARASGRSTASVAAVMRAARLLFLLLGHGFPSLE
jgi:hypothetical protein